MQTGNIQGNRPKIVIVGNGFGGVYTARHLQALVRNEKADVTLIGRSNHFLFTPLLHEVATGGLSVTSIVEPLHEVFRDTGVCCIQEEVTRIDLEKRIIESTEGRVLPFDYLVIASGADTNTYNIPGAAEYTMPLKTLAHALAIRNRVIMLMEKASLEADSEKRKKMLSFAVVGGGPTGVETVAELVEFVHESIENYYVSKISHADVSVRLINALPDLIPQFHVSMRQKALEILKEKGVEVIVNASVVKIDADAITMKDGSTLAVNTIIWVAGVKGSLIPMVGTVSVHQSGRIVVDDCLRVAGFEGVFALGDIATTLSTDGKTLPMLAQVAEQEAVVVAQNISTLVSDATPQLQTYRCELKGMLLSLGQWQALGEIGDIRLSGFVMWWLWRTVYLFKFLSWKKRVKIVVEWTVNLFFPRDITRL